MLFTIIHKALFRPLNPGDGGCPSWSEVSRLLSGVGSFLAELWPLSCETTSVPSSHTFFIVKIFIRSRRI